MTKINLKKILLKDQISVWTIQFPWYVIRSFYSNPPDDWTVLPTEPGIPLVMTLSVIFAH